MSIEALEIICAKCRGNEWGPDTPRKEILAWFHDFAAAAIEQAERQESYWEEEARRYAGNADFWREKAKRQPLTDEEIERACLPLGAAMLSFTEVARAIERAHGIGGGE
jgi:hypothetical protein